MRLGCIKYLTIREFILPAAHNMPSRTIAFARGNHARLENGRAIVRLLSGQESATSFSARCLSRIRNHDHSIRAFVASAGLVTPNGGAPGGPLRGLPFAVKDLYDTCQFPTAYGSQAYANHKPMADAALVAMLKQTGGVVLGKTVTTEFAFSHPGPTRNPWNLAHTPGGSSSGSAAAVASGMAPFALGTQTAGSIIRPSSYCGIAGFKPSFGEWPTTGIKCFSWSLDTIGFFAPTHMAMRAILARLSAEEHPHAPDGLPRLALVRTPIWAQAAPEMQEAVNAAAALARAAGWKVNDVNIGEEIWAGFAAQMTIQGFEAARALAGEFETVPHLLSDALKAEILRGLTVAGEDYTAACAAARRARQAIAALFESHTAILTPSAAGSAPPGLLSTGSPDFNRLWTLLGLPCANVPGFADARGLPLGVQLVGSFRNDGALLHVAEALEGLIALNSA